MHGNKYQHDLIIGFPSNHYKNCTCRTLLTFLNHLHFSPWRPPVLPVTRMRPWLWAFICGRNAWMVWMVPRRLTSRMCLIEFKDCTSSGPIKPTPALHTANSKDKHINPLKSHFPILIGTHWHGSIPRMFMRFSTILSLASRMDCRSVTSIWSMSKVSLCRPFTPSKRRSFLDKFLIVAYTEQKASVNDEFECVCKKEFTELTPKEVNGFHTTFN